MYISDFNTTSIRIFKYFQMNRTVGSMFLMQNNDETYLELPQTSNPFEGYESPIPATFGIFLEPKNLKLQSHAESDRNWSRCS